ncbi:MAG TPA: hypothetical protein EYP40_00480 [Chromatiales bacterium]|nr:hypothetical protein [Chromatiales bacterium]
MPQERFAGVGAGPGRTLHDDRAVGFGSRLHDGMHMGSASEHEDRPALSLIKLYIATYVMEKGEYEDKYEALDMIASSSDNLFIVSTRA